MAPQVTHPTAAAPRMPCAETPSPTLPPPLRGAGAGRAARGGIPVRDQRAGLARKMTSTMATTAGQRPGPGRDRARGGCPGAIARPDNELGTRMALARLADVAHLAGWLLAWVGSSLTPTAAPRQPDQEARHRGRAVHRLLDGGACPRHRPRTRRLFEPATWRRCHRRPTSSRPSDHRATSATRRLVPSSCLAVRRYLHPVAQLPPVGTVATGQGRRNCWPPDRANLRCRLTWHVCRAPGQLAEQRFL